MNQNSLQKFFNPGERGRLRWVIASIALLFIVTAFISLIGGTNKVASTIDNGLSSIPVINSAKIWPTLQVNQLDGSKRLVWKNIKEIDLTSYGPTFRLGLDLQGGAQLIYDADLSNIPLNERQDALEGAKDVIERRVNALGVSEPIVQTSMSGQSPRISVELAGVYDINSAIKMIGETPLLEFKEENPNAIRLTDEQQKQLEQMNLEVRKKAVDVLQKAKAGEDFAGLASQYSEDPGTKNEGGFYTIKPDSGTVAEFEDAAKKLGQGEISSDLVQTVYGYHIIKKETDRGSGDNKEMDVRHILFLTKTAKDLGIVQPEEWINTKLSGKNLKRASLQYDSTTMIPQVSLEFDNEGAQLFSEITERNVGKPVAIFLDGGVISAPNVNEAIFGGKAVISGNFSIDEAKQLAQRLNAGALPVPVALISQTTVGATLGSVAVQKSLVAGFWGLMIVALFMILFYRLPGILAVLSLAAYASISLAVFKLFPGYTLTLAGITGFILSIGMAVDANILIFERMKEELRNGRDLVKAVEEGFSRAWTSIRDSNASSLITCFILWWFGSSIIKGFALTLAIGIVISMFSAVIISRQLLLLVAKWKISKIKWLYNANKQSK
jgi:protein-export membrane protein SecD